MYIMRRTIICQFLNSGIPLEAKFETLDESETEICCKAWIISSLDMDFSQMYSGCAEVTGRPLT